VNTGQATSKAELIILSAILQVSAVAAQFSDNPINPIDSDIVGTGLANFVIGIVNFLAPGVDITSPTSVALFLSIFGVLILSNYSFIRTVFMVIHEEIKGTLSISDTAFDNKKVPAALSVLVAYISTYSLGVLFTFTLSGIAGTGIVLILFAVGLGAGSYVVYQKLKGSGLPIPDGGYVDTDGEVAQTVEDATERISAAQNEDPQRALADEKEALDEIEEVEDHLSDVLDQEQDRITELLQQLEQVIETDEDEREHLESIQEYLDQIKGALSRIEKGNPKDSDYETIGHALKNINDQSFRVANLEESDFVDIEHVVNDATYALDDLKKILEDITQIRRDLRKAEAVNSDLKSDLSGQLSQNLEIDETEREDAIEKASSLLEMQNQLMEELDSELGSLINKDSQAAGNIENKIDVDLSEENNLVDRMKRLSENDALNQRQKGVLEQGSDRLSKSMKTLSKVEKMRQQSDEHISTLEQKFEAIKDVEY
jgi:hypothetical protein